MLFDSTLGALEKSTAKRFCLAFVIIFGCSGAGHARDIDQQHAEALLVKLCVRCHAVGRSGRSPHPDAPPFRSFSDAKLYDEDFGQRLRDGLSTIHPDMPTFHFTRRDSEAVVSYLRAIQRPTRR